MDAPDSPAQGGSTHRLFSSTDLARWCAWAPLLAVSLALGGLNLVHMAADVGRPAPRDPWEAGGVVEAWRSRLGLPVYEDPDQGHATLMYGALNPYLAGLAERWTGPTASAGRALSAAAALGVVVGLAGLAASLAGGPWSKRVAVFALTGGIALGLHLRSGHYFATFRPDLPALAVALAGLVLVATGRERRSNLQILVGVILLGASVLLKQTTAVLTVVPAAVVVLDRGRRAWRDVLIVAAPVAAVAVVLFGLRLLAPGAYHAMVEVPRRYELQPLNGAKWARELFLFAPAFLAAAAGWLAGFGCEVKSAGGRWLLAALAVAVPTSLLAATKQGGDINSLLPALGAMAVFTGWQFAGWVDAAARQGALRSFALGGLLSGLVLLGGLPHLTRGGGLRPTSTALDGEYGRVQEAVRSLGVAVICPEDPTIPLAARGHLGRNVYLELDSRPEKGNWPKSLPEPVLKELRDAEAVLDVVGWWQDPIHVDTLVDAGFEPASDVVWPFRSYRLWVRPGTGASERLAQVERGLERGTRDPDVSTTSFQKGD